MTLSITIIRIISTLIRHHGNICLIIKGSGEDGNNVVVTIMASMLYLEDTSTYMNVLNLRLGRLKMSESYEQLKKSKAFC